jgi:uncharacterized membrane protein YjdF
MDKAFIALGGSAIMGALHYLGSRFDLYYLFNWYDIMMHLIGGIAIALLATWILEKYNHATKAKILISVILIGIAWEVFEYFFGIALLPKENYVSDTIIDMIMDTIGALIVISIFKLKK